MALRSLFPRHFEAEDAIQIIGEASASALGPELNVLVWNIHKGRKKAWERDFQQLRQGMDLVLLQEAVMNTVRDGIFYRKDDWQWVMARSFRDGRTLFETGVKTGSHVPSGLQQSFPSEFVEPLLNTRKMVLATCYPLKGSDHELLVLNVHGINFVSLHKYRLQLLQISAILQSYVGPVILAGDFNSWSARRLKSVLETTSGSGLSEVSMERSPRWQHFNQNLDHVFYRGLTLVNADVQSDIRSSDHYPITIAFRT